MSLVAPGSPSKRLRMDLDEWLGFVKDAELASANLRTPESVMARTAVLRTLADALSASPPGDLDDHVVDDLCALFGGDAPLVVEAILRRHPHDSNCNSTINHTSSSPETRRRSPPSPLRAVPPARTRTP